jgi:putative chitinase
MTPGDLILACPMPLERATYWAPFLTAAMLEYGIAAPEDRAMFIAQVGHESGSLKYVRELWGPTAQQEKYEGRADLGNVRPGDGFRFRGRGPLQITGRANYRDCGLELGFDLEAAPELLELPHNGARAAGWFWRSHGLSKHANDIVRATRIINGGQHGIDDRRRRLVVARAAMGLPPL